MNAIINMTGLALDTNLTPRQQHYLSVVHSSSKNLLGIINDILDFSKIEAEKLELEHAPFSLRKVLDEVTETFPLPGWLRSTWSWSHMCRWTSPTG